MRYAVILITLLLYNPALSEEMPLIDLNQLVWENRIILILSEANDPGYKALLERYDDDIKERDIIWLLVDENEVLTNYMEKISEGFRVNIKKDFGDGVDKVILIGKDGGIKNTDTELNLEAIFEQIDSMPMRLQEMRLNN